MRIIILIIISIVGLQSFAQKIVNSARYKCVGTQLRESSPATVSAVKSNMFVVVRKYKEGRFELKSFVGDLKLANSYGDRNDEFNDSSYYGNFALYKVMNSENYSPRVYKGYTKFDNIEANGTINSEGWMSGSFMMDFSNGFSEVLKAHYVFQAGDHRGGTIDFSCQYSEFYN